jgi:hypothetical protein
VESAEYWDEASGKKSILPFMHKQSKQVGEDVKLDMH